MEPGVTLDVPDRAPSHGPIPCRVTLVADEPTLVATRGILDTALHVVLVRRDAPGVRFLATVDPHALMQPDPPLPDPVPAPPGVDPALVAPGYFTERRTLDPLDYGTPHPGAATYHVLAAFSRHHTVPLPLAVTDPHGPLPTWPVARAPGLPADADATIFGVPVAPGVVARAVLREGVPTVEGAFHLAPRGTTDTVTVPWVTVVALRLERTGGASAGSFTLDPVPGGVAVTGQFSIPLTVVAPRVGGGVVRVLVFAGDLHADPVDILLPDA